MPRKLLILTFVVVGLHVGEVLILGTSPVGSLLANSLQVFASAVATAMCFGASRRGRGLSKPFWQLVGCGMATWGIASLGWMYYDNWLHIAVPALSVTRFLFDLQGVFFAIALFLGKEKESENFNAETLLDALQIAIVFFSLFFGLYYVQLLRGGAANELAMTWLFEVINVTLAVLSGILTATASTPRLRSLYGGLAFFLFCYAVGSGIADYMQAIRHVPTGTWFDLGWTLPFLVAAIWAARWKETAESLSAPVFRKKTLGKLALTNVMLALPPLIVLVLVTQMGREWRLVGFYLLGVSILCYAARLGVTEYRQAQSAEAVRRHTLAMESAVDGIAILDQKGEHFYVNSAFARMMGYESPQAMLGLSWRQVYDPRDVERHVEQVRASLRKTGKWSGHLVTRRPDGSTFPLEMTVTLLPAGGTVCVGRDITERLKAEGARFDAEARYRMFIEQVAAISYIAELGIDGQWLYVSPQVEMILGYSPDEWLANSRQWIRYVPPEDHPVIQAAEAASLGDARFQAEYRIIRKDGQVIWVNDTAVIVPGSDRHPVVEGIIVDITDRKLLETQLQQSRRMEAVGRLAGGIAHDFNNLLTIIKGYTELAQNRAQAQPELHSDIERIQDAAERAAGLVRQLLAFGRRQILQPKKIDLNSIVLGLDKLLRRLMAENIEMRTVVAENIGIVKADPGQVEQVIMNLVVNARDAMPDGGRLTVETSNVELDAAYARDHVSVRPGQYVMLAVSDTGTGMDPDTEAHIFEPFYTTKESGKGTGLGLSTVYGIIKQSGGYIWVYSEKGKGTTFKVYLPRVDELAESLAAPKSGSLETKGTETILLVEDEPSVRDLIEAVLVELGYSVIIADSPERALKLCETQSKKIDLLLTDVVMPGLSGRELAKRVTARHPETHVLYMSGYTHNFISAGGMLEDGIAFIQKPFSPAVLAEKIRTILDSPLAAK